MEQLPNITQTEYLAEYKEKKKTFYELSVVSHEHNTFTEDHMSTLTDIGHYPLN